MQRFKTDKGKFSMLQFIRRAAGVAMLAAVIAPSALTQSPPPRIFFTDLTSGPATGGEGGAGAYVTIYGNFFGTSAGSVTIGGVKATNYKLWGTPWLWYQKIAFQIPTGTPQGGTNITVTTANGTSNAMPFTVRAGNIYCVSTTGNDSNPGTFSGGCWATLPKAKKTMANGDITYAENGVAATTDDWTYSAAYTLMTSGTQWGGTQALPKALIGYPGATVTVGVDKNNGSIYRGIKTGGADHYVFANLHLHGDGEAIDGSIGIDDLRFVGNDITCPNGNEPNGCVGSGTGGADTNYFYGNLIHDVAANVVSSVTKLYHSMYIGDGSTHWQIGWNTIQHNHGNRAIQVYTSSTPISDIHVHDNLIYDSRGVGILFNSEGLEDTSDIYNNVVYHAGIGPDFSDGASSYHCYLQGSTNPGTINVYNNTFEDCGTSSQGGELIFYGSTTVKFRNNIVYALAGQRYFDSDSNNTMLTGNNNLWFGAGNGPSQTTGNVNADAKFASLSIPDFHLLSGSPAIDAGVATASLTQDVSGIPRPQGSAYDIGAYEYYKGSGGPAATCDLNGDGVVDSTDVQIALQQAVGTAACGNADLQQNGSCNVIDVQRVINASLGQTCRIGP